jgi:hypothetical protein
MKLLVAWVCRSGHKRPGIKNCPDCQRERIIRATSAVILDTRKQVLRKP